MTKYRFMVYLDGHEGIGFYKSTRATSLREARKALKRYLDRTGRVHGWVERNRKPTRTPGYDHYWEMVGR